MQIELVNQHQGYVGLPRAVPLFDAYIMIDWSGADRRRAGKQDCIWIAYGAATTDTPKTISPASRTEAEQFVRAQLDEVVAAKTARVLVCADFGYAYPAGFAALLRNCNNSDV